LRDRIFYKRITNFAKAIAHIFSFFNLRARIFYKHITNVSKAIACILSSFNLSDRIFYKRITSFAKRSPIFYYSSICAIASSINTSPVLQSDRLYFIILQFARSHLL
jgi:hypothetical protein